MRIAFLSVSDQLGGSEIALLELLRGIRAARPDWPLDLILPGQGPLHGRASALGVRCSAVAPPASLMRIGEFSAMRRGWSPAATLTLGARLCAVAAAWPAYERRLRTVLTELHPDVLHTNGLKAHVAGARAASADTAVVWHLHEYVRRRPVTAALLRRHVNRCRAIVANSASVAHDATAAVGVSPAAQVVHNAVDLDRFTPSGAGCDLDALAGLPAAPTGTVRVGMVATFSKWKGHDVFLRALAALPPETPVRGYIVGGPLYDTIGSQYTRELLATMACELGVPIGFTGFIDADAAIRALDIVVHASTEPEPFGLVIAEAMACGRALITSATGGAAELVTPGVDAVVHSPGDARSLADAIATLASSAALRQQLGARARTSALQRFHPQRLAASMIDVYERAATGTRRDRRKTA